MGDGLRRIAVLTYSSPSAKRDSSSGEPTRPACRLRRLAATNFMHVPSQWRRPEKVRDGEAPSPTRGARVLPRMNGFAVQSAPFAAGSEMG